MKVTNGEKREKSTVELTIQVEAQEFEDAVQKAYLKNRAHIIVPGFRKGKAPRKLVEQMATRSAFHPTEADRKAHAAKQRSRMEL